MNLNDLHRVLSRGEDTHTELKEVYQKVPDTFYDTVVSFLNRESGTIILGVNDTKNIIGIEPEGVEQTMKDRPNSPDQRYITTEKGRRFLGGFDI